MSSDVLVDRVKEAAQSANWLMLHRYLNQYFATSSSRKDFSSESDQLSSSEEQRKSTTSADQHVRLNILSIALRTLQAGDFQVRWDLAKVIPNFGSVAIAPLIALLDEAQGDDDWELIWFIARILGNYPCPEAIATLSDLLRSTSQQDIATVAIDALASIGESAIPTLSTLAQEPSTRLSAVRALAQIRHPSVVDILIMLAQDDDATIRVASIVTLGHIHQPRITQLLIQSLGDPSSSVRRSAVVGLSLQLDMISESQFLKVTEPLLWDINLDVRRQAVLALSRLKSVNAVHVLFRTLCSPHTPNLLNGDILRALIWTESKEALQCLQEFIDKAIPKKLSTFDRNDSIQSSSTHIKRLDSVDVIATFLYDVANTFGLIEQEESKALATEILVDLLHVMDNSKTYRFDDVQIRQAIAHSLGHLGQISAVPSLTRLLRDHDKRVQLHTSSALKKILGNASFMQDAAAPKMQAT